MMAFFRKNYPNKFFNKTAQQDRDALDYEIECRSAYKKTGAIRGRTFGRRQKRVGNMTGEVK